LPTPATSCARLGFIETLKGPARQDAAARERFLDIMQDQARRMTRLIDDLLSLSRIEMRAHLPPVGTTDLAGVATHIVETLSPLAKSEGVTIAVAIPEGPLMVHGDRDELLRMAENLIENAIKSGAGGGTVEVALARAMLPGGAPGVALSVRDRGPGIAADDLPRLTERFYRVDVAQSRNKGGTGLGLAIVKHIVTRHRGHLAVRSEPGHGAEFTVTLPQAAPDPP
jgi:two-component system, OmpR family, phosphate regulon sensor histidine kinase PhoR